MGTGYLPNKDTSEAKKLIERFLNGDIQALQKELKYTRRSVMYRAFQSTYGVRYSDIKWAVKPIEEELPTIIPAPEIKIKPIKQEGRRGEGEEVHLQEISDAHNGLITPSYNLDVFHHRLTLLQRRLVNLCLLHRKMRPIKKLVAACLGDMPQGEQIGVQGYAEEFACGAEEQIFKHLVPAFSDFFVNLLQVYQEIEVEVIPGNHGNIQRRSQIVTKQSNWDTVWGRALAVTLSNYKRIKVNVVEPGQWYKVIEINGWRFLLAHGDQIVSYQGVPFYGLERRGLRWKQSIGVDEPFDYMLTAHVHNPNFLWNAGVPTYVNGTFVSDSNFPLVRMGLRDVPQQWSLFVNKRYGVTASYRIQL